MKPAPKNKQTFKFADKKQAGNNPSKKAEISLRPDKTTTWMILLGLVIFTFVIYGNSINNGYAGDDDIITLKNRFVQQGMKGIPDIFHYGFLYGFNNRNDQSYRPVTLTTVAIETAIWKNDPHMHHFFNVFWYALTAVFLFLTLTLLFRKYNYVVPLLITLLFIAHPVHTEVVANIKSRDEILSFFFCIVALYCSLKHYCYNQPVGYLYLSWVFFFLAILCKETVLMYFLIIPMIYYFFTDFKEQKLLMISTPLASIVVLYIFIRWRVLDAITFNEPMEVINNSLMSAHNEADRLATTIFILGKYIWLLFVPLKLTWDYSYSQIPVVSFTSPEALISLAVYGGLIAYAIIRLQKKDPVAFGIFYFIITMFLVSNLLVKIGSTMGERFLYTSSLGFCIAIAFLLVKVLKIRTDNLKPDLKTLYVVAGIILLAYSVKTIARNPDWKNNYALFSSAADISTNSARAHQAMAITYTDTANKCTNIDEKNKFFNKAIPEYYAALKILPTYSEALYNLGWNYFSMQQFDSAAVAFEKCIKADPKFTNAYNDLGVIYFNRKNYPKAISIFKTALYITPNDPGMLENIGAAYYNMNRFDSCIYFSKLALDVNPNSNNARVNLCKAQNALANQPH